MLFLILLYCPYKKKNHVSQAAAGHRCTTARLPFFKWCLTWHSAAAASVLVNDVRHRGAEGLRLLVLTWMQQEALDGYVEEPFEPLVLLLGAQNFGLVLQHRVFNGAENLFGGRRQPVVQEHVQQLQFGHVFFRTECLQRQNVLLFTSTTPEVECRCTRVRPGSGGLRRTGDRTALAWSRLHILLLTNAEVILFNCLCV